MNSLRIPKDKTMLQMPQMCFIVLMTFLHSCFLLAQNDFTDSLSHDGGFRSFVVHFPPDYDPDETWPAVMVLHGGGERNGGAELLTQLTFDEVADTAGYLAIFPNGLFRDWADARGVTESSLAGTDDVGFLSSLADTLIGRYGADPERIYVVGGSNGGMMVQSLACEASDRFAAFATVIASMPENLVDVCRPDNAAPMLLMNGTADPLVPYGGGPLASITQGGSVIGTDQTIEFWLAHNGCEPSRVDSTAFPDLRAGDGSTVVRHLYPVCESGALVSLYRIDGGGHTVPGARSLVNPLPLVGFLNKDIDAAAEIWRFFRLFRRSASTSLESYNKTSVKLQLAPNPWREGDLEIGYPLEAIEEIAVFNAAGLKVWQGSGQQRMQLQAFDSGMYFVVVRTKKQAFLTGKLLISR